MYDLIEVIKFSKSPKSQLFLSPSIQLFPTNLPPVRKTGSPSSLFVLLLSLILSSLIHTLNLHEHEFSIIQALEHT